MGKLKPREHPDTARYKTLIYTWNDYIWSLANKYSGKTTMQADDYYQEACMKLWDKRIETVNSMYAGKMIRTAMSNLYRDKVKKVIEFELPMEGDL